MLGLPRSVAGTLSSLHGLRLPTTSPGLGDEATDANIISTGLLERVDVVQGGGAAVYGSGAIAGVVNYVLKDHYDGEEIQAQYAHAQDYNNPQVRAMFGRNFTDNRENIALELDHSRQSSLDLADRWNEFAGQAVPNLAPGAGHNGIPVSIYPNPGTNFNGLYTGDGVVVSTPCAVEPAQGPQINGNSLQINSSGNLVPIYLGTPFPGEPSLLQSGCCNAGPVNYSVLQLVAPMERSVANLIGHYDLTDDVSFYSRLMYADIGSGYPDHEWLESVHWGNYAFFPNLSPIVFTASNPYLSAATVAQLSALDPGFAAGQPLYLSKVFTNVPSQYADYDFDTKTLDATVGFKGAFTAIGRDFYWDASYTHASVSQTSEAYQLKAFSTFRVGKPI